MGVNGRPAWVWGVLGVACILVAVLGLLGIVAAVPQAGDVVAPLLQRVKTGTATAVTLDVGSHSIWQASDAATPKSVVVRDSAGKSLPLERVRHAEARPFGPDLLRELVRFDVLQPGAYTVLVEGQANSVLIATPADLDPMVQAMGMIGRGLGLLRIGASLVGGLLCLVLLIAGLVLLSAAVGRVRAD